MRYRIPTRFAASPYVLGGAGVARLTPTAAFTYSSGTLPGTTPALGDDVTSQVVSLGAFTQPAPTNAFMFTMGGGVQMPTAPRVSVDVGYRVRASKPTRASTRTASSRGSGIGSERSGGPGGSGR